MSKSSSPALDRFRDPQNMPLLLQLAEVAHSSLDLDKVLERIAHLMRQYIECEIVAILLLDESANELYVRYAIGISEEVRARTRIPLGHGLTGMAAATQIAVLANDVSADPRYVAALPDVRSELAIPLLVANRVIGVLDLQSIQLNYFTELHREQAMLAGQRAAAAVQNARIYRSTLREAHILGQLAEISREFSSILQLNDLLRKIAELVRVLISYDSFNILLLDERDNALRNYLSMRATEEMKEKIAVPLGEGIVGHAAREGVSLVAPNVLKDPRYIPINAATRAEMAVPLIVKDRVIGVLDLESMRARFFTSRHLHMMELLAPQVAIAIENARLYEKLAREERRMERDLAAARELQASLLPHCCPVIEGVQIAAAYEPAREVGGDLYDFIEYEPDAAPGPGTRALGVFVGDVSGKGTAAALYAALSHGLIRTLAQRRQPAGQLMARLNKVICERRIEARSLALCFALLDMDKHTLEMANAGLPHPIFCRGGKVMNAPVDGVPLGLLENIAYQPYTIHLEPGDLIIIYTDGISENFNRQHEEYGRRRLREFVDAHCALPAKELARVLFEEMDRWAEGKNPSDDRTVVVLRVGEEASCTQQQ